MTLRTEWTAIAGRIEGFLNAASSYFLSMSWNSDDPYQGYSALLPQASLIYRELVGFADRHSGTLPSAARDALARFVDAHSDFFDPEPYRSAHLKRIAPALGSVVSEVDYHLADHSAVALRLSERAFLHLQRTLVVDSDARGRWQRAIDEGELACEKFGSVHLLQHGIWAFKVDATGERTDLVFSESGVDEDEVEAAAQALVLTEWKVVRSQGEREGKALEGRQQAQLYSVGSLAGLELAGYRFIVLVSKQQLEPIPDLREGEVTYRHINIAVDPLTPSQVSRR